VFENLVFSLTLIEEGFAKPGILVNPENFREEFVQKHGFAKSSRKYLVL